MEPRMLRRRSTASIIRGASSILASCVALAVVASYPFGKVRRNTEAELAHVVQRAVEKGSQLAEEHVRVGDLSKIVSGRQWGAPPSQHTTTNCQCVQKQATLSYCATDIVPYSEGKSCKYRQCAPKWECVHQVPVGTQTRNCEKVIVRSRLSCSLPISGDDGTCICSRISKPTPIWVPTY